MCNLCCCWCRLHRCCRRRIYSPRSKKGIEWAKKVFKNSPGLMISISDGNDIHFRKAKFDPLKCPPNCPRPCEKVCPTFAIDNSGIKKSKCYGCGRCLNSCPLNLISEYEYNLSKDDLGSTLLKISLMQ